MMVRLDRARDLGLAVVEPDDIYGVDCDIFAPCALGGVINPDTIPQLKCKVVAGGANNQLLSGADGEELHRLGIIYGPDYILNSGGIINAEAEIGREYNPDRAREKTERIYEIMEKVIAISKREEIPTAKAADRLAEDRLNSVRSIRRSTAPASSTTSRNEKGRNLLRPVFCGFGPVSIQGSKKPWTQPRTRRRGWRSRRRACSETDRSGTCSPTGPLGC